VHSSHGQLRNHVSLRRQWNEQRPGLRVILPGIRDQRFNESALRVEIAFRPNNERQRDCQNQSSKQPKRQADLKHAITSACETNGVDCGASVVPRLNWLATTFVDGNLAEFD
jgi:hypothetical protein